MSFMADGAADPTLPVEVSQPVTRTEINAASAHHPALPLGANRG